MARVFLALGSNLGDRRAHLESAVAGLVAHPEIRVIAMSSVYETDPVGGPVQDDYLNAVVEVTTDLDPFALLAVAQGLESDARRVREVRWGPRTLDVDILWYEDVQLDDERLTIPHPRMHERHFVLAPLHELAPELVDRPAAGWSGVRRVALTDREQ